MAQENAEKASWWRELSPEERKHRRDLRLHRRNYFNTAIPRASSTLDRAARWLLPWDWHCYPGFRNGLAQAMMVSAASVAHWRRGLAGVPVYRKLAAEIERRCRAGMELVALLTAEADRMEKARKPRGLQIRDPETGLPKYRHRIGSGEKPSEDRRKERKL